MLKPKISVEINNLITCEDKASLYKYLIVSLMRKEIDWGDFKNAVMEKEFAISYEEIVAMGNKLKELIKGDILHPINFPA